MNDSWLYGVSLLIFVLVILTVFWSTLSRWLLIRGVELDRRTGRRPFYHRGRLIQGLALSLGIFLFGMVWFGSGFGPLIGRELAKLESNVDIVTYRDGSEVKREPTRAPVVALGVVALVVGVGGGTIALYGLYAGIRIAFARRREAGLESADYALAALHFSRTGDERLARELCVQGISLIEKEVAADQDAIRRPQEAYSDYFKRSVSDRQNLVEKVLPERIQRNLQHLNDLKRIVDGHQADEGSKQGHSEAPL